MDVQEKLVTKKHGLHHFQSILGFISIIVVVKPRMLGKENLITTRANNPMERRQSRKLWEENPRELFQEETHAIWYKLKTQST